jgi:uncharacterized protein (TIGR02453 family)
MEIIMPSPLNLGSIQSFLSELSLNNNKIWFDDHRPVYNAARETFEKFINGLIDEFRVPDNLQDLTARECMTRIYRDIRFSKNKTPYKTNMAAMIAPGGWKAPMLGYYISIEPKNQSIAAGGLYNPTPEQLNRFRQVIEWDASAFKKLLQGKEFIENFHEIEGDRLKTAPKGYERTHPEIELLQLKQLFVVHHFTDDEVLANNFSEKVVKVCRAMKPFLTYLNEIVN